MPQDKVRLVARLQEILRLAAEDWTWLKLAGAVFSCWDNESDADYDRYDCGSVVLISFPFTSLDASKKRPAVGVSRPSYQEATHDIVLAAVTSQVDEGPGDVALRYWSEAGLLKPPWLQVGKLVIIYESLVLRALGRLPTDDWNSGKQRLGAVLAD